MKYGEVLVPNKMALFHFQWILGEEEVEVKTKLWMIANADYLQEQKGT